MSRTTLMSGTMSEAQFRKVCVRFTRMPQRLKDLARLVLVDGLSPGKVAATNGASADQVAVCAAQLFHAHVPEGWTSARVTLPPHLMAQVRQMELAARSELRKSPAQAD